MRVRYCFKNNRKNSFLVSITIEKCLQQAPEGL